MLTSVAGRGWLGKATVWLLLSLASLDVTPQEVPLVRNRGNSVLVRLQLGPASLPPQLRLAQRKKNMALGLFKK